MKTFLFVFLVLSFSSFGQIKYSTKTGTVNFEASVPSFEEVTAKNNSVSAIINIENGDFAALALIKAFRFKNALMEEHFNENYAESSKYPKATFKGRIEDFSLDVISTSKHTYKISGELTFHGVTKQMDSIEVVISKTGNSIFMEGEFKANASDFDIKIPSVVRNKIAEDILIHFNFELKN